MTVDVGSYTKNGAYADRPGTFVFINGKKYRTVIIVQ